MNSGQHMIESRRRAENAYKEMEAVSAGTILTINSKKSIIFEDNKRVYQIANFEHVTTSKIERRFYVIFYKQISII